MSDEGNREVLIDGQIVPFWVTAAMAFGGTASGRRRSLYAQWSGQPTKEGHKLQSPADHDNVWDYSEEDLATLWRRFGG